MYLSSDEFLDLERARLTLRAYGIGVDRGRLVREAIALLMTDLEAGIDASVIARRLRAIDQPEPDGAAAAVGPTSAAPLNGAAQVNGGYVPETAPSGGPAVGVLANGIGVTGPPEGPQ